MNTTPRPMIVTDSSGLLSAEQAEAAGVIVVPLVISIDGQEFSEGVDLTNDDFYSRVVPGVTDVATSQPAPGAFIDAFELARSRGATEVLAVLVGGGLSGTVDSALVAAKAVDLAVRTVDTGTTSFGLGACALAAAAVCAEGGSIDEAETAASTRADQLASVFVLNGLELARRSGRFGDLGAAAGSSEEGDHSDDDVPVLWSGRGEIQLVASVPAGPGSFDAAVAAMAERVLATEGDLVVASGVAHPDTESMADALETALEASGRVRERIRYRVGPSVAAHTGPGTAGAFYWPAEAESQRHA